LMRMMLRHRLSHMIVLDKDSKISMECVNSSN
jgi:hypothetical protein